MAKIFNPPRFKVDNYGKIINNSKGPIDFQHLLGLNVQDIILFDNGTDELLEQGAIILPRHYYIFVGVIDGEVQFKPYENDEHRIVVATYKGIITDIDSVG